MLNSMQSQIGWVDFSPEDRDRVRQVLSQLQEPGTLDELGIGAIRDGFSDLLFPGFSTIQTRAKYLITVPRILRSYDRLKHKNKSLEVYLKEQENRVAELLVKYHGEGAGLGIIGGDSIHTGGVARRPSAVYWNAFRVWKIIETTQSLAQFCRGYGGHEIVERFANGDEADDKDSGAKRQIVHLDKLISDDVWMDGLSLQLTKSEASFLAEKIGRGPAESVPEQVVRNGLLEKIPDLGRDFYSLSAWLQSQSRISSKTKEYARLAVEFSEALFGAHIRFNCILARKNKMDSLDDLEEQWQSWRQSVDIQSYDIDAWFAILGRVHASTYQFVRRWCQAVIDDKPIEQLDELVSLRSLQTKEKRSLLNKALSKEQGWVGMGQQQYRWGTVRQILVDIQEGLSC